MPATPGDQAQPTVGFVGLGDQGAPIAQAIGDSGYPLLVWARRPASLDALDGTPFTAANSVAELAAGSDVVALCLPQDSDNVQVAMDGGLLENMRPGTILINHGTGLPSEAQKLTELAAPYDIAVLDAPVSGGHAVAVARQLTTIVGGPAAAVEKVTPIFKAFSKIVIHMGPVGTGQFGKLFNNALMMLNQRNIAEVLEVATKLDLPLQPLIEVLRSGSATSFALQAFGGSVTSENAAHLKQLQLIDMGLFSAAVEGLGDQARNVVDRAVDASNRLPELTTNIEANTAQ
ncbi:NAD(P)-dependent oxidoreductase [Saccharopolyspora sp. K220]|uniref:NAD(P)-dependent oxidoreductase n=1 Tax=Saccharopolyspora soli TaxID=2926618 RepID=UPI001F59FAC0|nr:NAD(P)-dependent oxidoreductase [Saccharopolyspora soli]MCI2424369.1 NAD(P)-dependent oxidoreductase [Saccharopolyspora soli]